MVLMDNCKMLRYLLFDIGDQRMVLIYFDCGIKAWVDNFVGCCGRMYIEFFFRPRCLFAIFLTKRMDNRRSGIQNIDLVFLCVWMKEKNVVMFYFIIVRIRFCFFV